MRWHSGSTSSRRYVNVSLYRSAARLTGSRWPGQVPCLWKLQGYNGTNGMDGSTGPAGDVAALWSMPSVGGEGTCNRRSRDAYQALRIVHLSPQDRPGALAWGCQGRQGALVRLSLKDVRVGKSSCGITACPSLTKILTL